MGVVKGWEGRFYEDFEIGDVYRSRLGRTVTETDNIWFTNLTLNTNQVHFNNPFGEASPFGKVLVNSAFTVALVTGLSVTDVSENAMANLAWDDIRLPNPVFVGDTVWCESEVLEKRESSSRPYVGIVGIRTRGLNQRKEVICEFRRTMMIYRREGAKSPDVFPVTDAEWQV
ncbi:MAG: MaoC family dehydratase [Actinomycetota bacterium]